MPPATVVLIRGTMGTELSRKACTGARTAVGYKLTLVFDQRG